jgi:hypothetical protein
LEFYLVPKNMMREQAMCCLLHDSAPPAALTGDGYRMNRKQN